jgi:hypothetical protein
LKHVALEIRSLLRTPMLEAIIMRSGDYLCVSGKHCFLVSNGVLYESGEWIHSMSIDSDPYIY